MLNTSTQNRSPPKVSVSFERHWFEIGRLTSIWVTVVDYVSAQTVQIDSVSSGFAVWSKVTIAPGVLGFLKRTKSTIRCWLRAVLRGTWITPYVESSVAALVKVWNIWRCDIFLVISRSDLSHNIVWEMRTMVYMGNTDCMDEWAQK